MNKELIWGIPTQKTKRTEKFNTPVVSMAALEGKGTGRKFSFNKAAQDALGLEGGETYVRFGFSEDGQIFIQASTVETPEAFLLTKQCTFSNKKLYEYIAKTSGLDNTMEQHLHLTVVEGAPYYSVSSIEAEGMTIATSEEEVAETLEPATNSEESFEEETSNTSPVFAVDNSEEVDSEEEEWA